jgi:hypothetical protein
MLSLRTVRGSLSVFVQVTTAPALIVKNMAMGKSSLITLSETWVRRTAMG